MTVLMIILLHFKPEATPEIIKEQCDAMMSLKDLCVRPMSDKPYIKSAQGGSVKQPVWQHEPVTHGFLLEFDNDDDRIYYAKEDPVHTRVRDNLMPNVVEAKVYRISPGEWDHEST